MADQPQPPPADQPPPVPPDAKPPDDTTSYAKYFTDGAFWEKVKGFAGRVGRATLTKALELYNVATDPGTPVWAKAVAIGSLGYFILPLDVVPDVIPGLGLADDAAALAAAATMLLKHMTPAIRAKASEQVAKWFGADPNAPAVPPAADVPSPS